MGRRSWLGAIYTSVHGLVLLVPLAVLPMIWFRLNLQVCSSVASFSACEQRIRMNSVVMSTTREERRTMIALQPMEGLRTNNHADTKAIITQLKAHMYKLTRARGQQNHSLKVNITASNE